MFNVLKHDVRSHHLELFPCSFHFTEKPESTKASDVLTLAQTVWNVEPNPIKQ